MPAHSFDVMQAVKNAKFATSFEPIKVERLVHKIYDHQPALSDITTPQILIQAFATKPE